MKKLFCLLLVLVLFPAACLADLPDVSGLSKEELIELDIIINNILFERSLPDGILIPSGDYIVGADIPAGEYRADVVSDVGGRVAVYPSKEKAEKDSMSYLFEAYLGNMWGTLTFRLVLEDGNYLTIKYNSLKLYPYLGLVDLSIPKK